MTTTTPPQPKRVEELPIGVDFIYEPKFDGWRGIAFGGIIWSRNYHPIEEAPWIPEGMMLDGEVMDGGYVAWDILMLDGADVRDLPWIERRALLEEATASLPIPTATFTDEPSEARTWMTGDGLDGIVAKRVSESYGIGWLKVKPVHTVDAVVIGQRNYRSGSGAVELGLWDGDSLRKVGYAPGFFEIGSVVEVKAGQIIDGRFRHQAKVIRQRPDKASRECTVDQLHAPQV